MAVQGNQGEVIVTKGIKTIYGIAPFKVLLVNPTMDELISLGVKATKEPEYATEDKMRIDFWCKTVLPEHPIKGSTDKSLEELGIEDQMVHKFTSFISNKTKGKADGSTETWINNFGSVCSVLPGQQPSATWWKTTGQRKAKEGEIELIKFIRAWVNAGPNDEVFFDDWDALVRGNVKELREIIATFKDNIVRLMIEVKVTGDGKTYSSIGNKHFEPWNVVGLTYWAKQYKVTPKNVYHSFQLAEFVPPVVTPTEDPTPDETSDWG